MILIGGMGSCGMMVEFCGIMIPSLFGLWSDIDSMVCNEDVSSIRSHSFDTDSDVKDI